MSGEKFNLAVVVDDDVVYLDTVALMLRAIGFKQIKTYENGLDAIEAIENDRPDLVISDWDMPIMTGIDLLMALTRAIENYQYQKVWEHLTWQAMRQSFSWSLPARKYAELYTKAVHYRRALG